MSKSGVKDMKRLKHNKNRLKFDSTEFLLKAILLVVIVNALVRAIIYSNHIVRGEASNPLCIIVLVLMVLAITCKSWIYFFHSLNCEKIIAIRTSYEDTERQRTKYSRDGDRTEYYRLYISRYKFTYNGIEYISTEKTGVTNKEPKLCEAVKIYVNSDDPHDIISVGELKKDLVYCIISALAIIAVLSMI